tara:strand:+ start:368 stop:1156 length:789 start_codon:yes stop_codon:yes gene_type:complete
MFELQYFFIGFIQGITEFLPISSSAHLILISQLTDWEDQGIFIDIAVHGGTLGAVIIYLLKDIKAIIFDFFVFKKNNSNFFALKILIATIPGIFVGFLMYEYFLVYFRNLIVIAWSSIIFGIILFWSDQKKNSTKKWEDLSFYEVFLIGLCQTLAFIPGASRAGVTITGARLLNVKRDSAAKFSMLLSIPIILASLTLSTIDLYTIEIHNFKLIQPIFSSIIAFVTALVSIHFMMQILKVTNYNIFIIYRILLGIGLLIFYA